MIKYAMIGVALLHSVSGTAQSVPEGIHRDGDGRADICGLKAATVDDLHRKVASANDVQVLDVTPEYRAYVLNKTLRQLTFTTPANRAHPAVACRTVVDAPGGGSSINTELVCHNSRENCDWLYREFEQLTKRTLRAMGHRN
jgi:hypothetical protein